MDAVSSNCESVLKHAMARKQRYLPIEIVSAPANLADRYMITYVCVHAG